MAEWLPPPAQWESYFVSGSGEGAAAAANSSSSTSTGAGTSTGGLFLGSFSLPALGLGLCSSRRGLNVGEGGTPSQHLLARVKAMSAAVAVVEAATVETAKANGNKAKTVNFSDDEDEGMTRL